MLQQRRGAHCAPGLWGFQGVLDQAWQSRGTPSCGDATRRRRSSPGRRSRPHDWISESLELLALHDLASTRGCFELCQRNGGSAGQISTSKSPSSSPVTRAGRGSWLSASNPARRRPARRATLRAVIWLASLFGRQRRAQVTTQMTHIPPELRGANRSESSVRNPFGGDEHLCLSITDAAAFSAWEAADSTSSGDVATPPTCQG